MEDQHHVSVISNGSSLAVDYHLNMSCEERTARYISDNFTLRQCHRYCKVDLSEDKEAASSGYFKTDDCVCGHSLDWHLRHNAFDRNKSTGHDAATWSTLKDATPHPCNTFGQLQFAPGDGYDSSTIVPGASAHYLRLAGQCDDSSYMESVYKLMTSKNLWSLPVPQLIIEVTGMAAPLPHVEQEVLDRFNSGLLKAAQTANAWIVTGGTNCGVMGLVGDAVSKWRMTTRENLKITCLGIVTYGVINRREDLVNQDSNIPVADISTELAGSIKRNDSKKNDNSVKINFPTAIRRKPAMTKYFVDKPENCDNGVSLNPGHNCFLFVDNAKEKRFGEEINFRAQFLHYLSQKTLRGKKANAVSRTPLVLLLVGGGPNSVRTVEISIMDLQSAKQVRPKSGGSSLANVRHKGSPVAIFEDHWPRPVIILSGFGGASDLIAFAYAISAPQPDKDQTHMYSQLFDKLPVNETSEFPPDFDERVMRHPAFEQILRKTPEHLKADEGEVILKRIRNCLKNRAMITVVNLNDEHDNVALDHAILDAIFKSRFGSHEATFQLAQLWNRIDIAKRLLGRHQNEIRQNVDLKTALTQAIKFGQTNFFKLLVDYNFVDLQNYLTLSQIRSIYSEIFIRRRGKPGKATCVWLFRNLLMISTGDEAVISDADNGGLLNQIGHLLSSLLGCYLNNVFTDEQCYLQTAQGDDDLLTVANSQLSLGQNTNRFNRPYQTSLRDLFLMQLILLRNDLALHIWEIGHDHVGTAVMAAILLKSLSREAKRLDMTDLATSFHELSDEWLSRAMCLLGSCYEQEPMTCYCLLTRSLHTWQGLTLLEMAFYGRKRRFMEQPAVQTTLAQIWLGEMATFTRPSLIYLTMLPPLLPFLIFRLRFEESSSQSSLPFIKMDENHQGDLISFAARLRKQRFGLRKNASTNSYISEEQRDGNKTIVAAKPLGWKGLVKKWLPFYSSIDKKSPRSTTTGNEALGESRRLHTPFPYGSQDVRLTKASLFDFNREGRISVVHAIYLLYSSPIAKYAIHSLATVSFLLMFSFFVLDWVMPEKIGVVEIILWVWCGVSFLEVLRDYFSNENMTFTERFLDFFTSVFAVWELFSVILLLVALILRLTLGRDQFIYGHSAYATACVLYWLKSMRIFFIFESVGPKVFTVAKMLRDLAFFVLIYVVLLLSFSMPIYALLYPTRNNIQNSRDFFDLLVDICYNRMWNIFVMALDDSRRIVEGTCRFSTTAKNEPIVLVQTMKQRFKREVSSWNSTTSPLTWETFPDGVLSRERTEPMPAPNEYAETTLFFHQKLAHNQSSHHEEQCSSRNIIAIVLYIIYLLLTNIVLLNMLIAMFAHTVDKTRLSATRLWRFDMYRLLHEYYTRPVLPGPLMLFELAYRFFRFIFRKNKSDAENTDLKQYYSSITDYEYRKLEMLERSLIKSAAHQFENFGGSRDDHLIAKLHYIHDRLQGRMERVEAKVVEAVDEAFEIAVGHSKNSPFRNKQTGGERQQQQQKSG